MGQLRFYAPTPEKLLPHAVELAYVAGLEAVPWRSQNSLTDNVLTIERNVSESGSLYICWDIPEIGERMLSTCTLMERSEPYCLVTELARGTLHRARAMVADMELAGRSVPASAHEQISQAIRGLISATTNPSAAQDPARQTILLASQAIEVLSAHDVKATLDDQLGSGNLSSILVGPASDSEMSGELAEQFVTTFQAVSIPLRWSQHQRTASDFDWSLARNQLQWGRARGLKTIVGPLIQLDRLSLPEWTDSREENYDQFETAAVHYVRAATQQFTGQVDIWVCSGRLNVPGATAFSEEQKLRLAVATLGAVRSLSPRTPVVISFDQPWAEYLADEDFDLSPLHFADALVRADLGVAGIALEMNLGYWPGGTQPRDLLAISRHMDRWNVLGIPLLAYLTLPSQIGKDPRAQAAAQVVPHSPQRQDVPAISQDLAEQLLPLLLSKPALRAVVWNQWSDAETHEFPHAGLLDAQGRPKPLLQTLANIRKKYLT